MKERPVENVIRNLPHAISLALRRLARRLGRLAITLVVAVILGNLINVGVAPFRLYHLERLGERICAQARAGKLSEITIKTDFPGLAGFGESVGDTLPFMAKGLAKSCLVSVRLGDYDGRSFSGDYLLTIGTPIPSADRYEVTTFHFIYYPVLSVIWGIFDPSTDVGEFSLMGSH